jgi:hypothetical protein
MPLPLSGPLSLSTINTELGLISTSTISLNDVVVRSLAGRPTGSISFENFYGQTSGDVLPIVAVGGTSTSNTESTIPYPTGIQQGDLIIFAEQASRIGSVPTPPTRVLPPGFTSMSDITSTVSTFTRSRDCFAWKIADGTETGNLTGTASSTNPQRKFIAVFRRTPAFTGVSSAGIIGSNIISTAPPTPIINSPISKPAIIIGKFYQSNTMAGQIMSPVQDFSVQTNTSSLKFKIFNNTSLLTPVTISMGDGGTNTLAMYAIYPI